MTQPPAERSFIDRILAGDIRAGARMMRLVDDRHPAAFALLRQLHAHAGRARIIGVTGNPGSGKSTLTDRLVSHYRIAGKRVGVVAIDPSSPFSGGAILGDRIRMSEHTTDGDVFIRSVATRGHLGGLSRSTHDIALIMDAMGYDPIIIETVGVGQDEVEVVKVAHTSVVVTVPGLGDEIQALKAGLLEIADIFVVNKADRDGVDRVLRDIKTLQGLASTADAAWVPPLIRTIATQDQGIDALITAIDAHGEATGRPDIAARRRARTIHVLETLVQDQLALAAQAALPVGTARDHLLDRLATGETDPYTEAEAVVAAVFAAGPPRPLA